jgi:hypothetical protein
MEGKRPQTYDNHTPAAKRSVLCKYRKGSERSQREGGGLAKDTCLSMGLLPIHMCSMQCAHVVDLTSPTLADVAKCGQMMETDLIRRVP